MSRMGEGRISGRARRCGVAGLFLLVLLPLAGETLRLATYNVENYGPTDRMIDGAFRSNYPKPEREKEALRAVIRAIDADILLLQEMGSEPYLEELARDLKRVGLDYPFRAVLDGPDPERHLAVLSRRPWRSLVRHAELDFSYLGETAVVSRGLLELRLETERGELAIFVVHLKSRLSDRSDDPISAVRREGESRAVRAVVAEEAGATADLFVVAGDFNDPPESAALALWQGLTRPVAARDAAGGDWTYHYDRGQTDWAFDQFLVSPALADAVAGGSAGIWDDPLAAQASDHRPVVLELELEPDRGTE